MLAMARVVLQKANHIELQVRGMVLLPLTSNLQAILQVDPEHDEWVSADSCVILFISFLKEATDELLPKIVKSVLNLKYCQGGRHLLLSQETDTLMHPRSLSPRR